MTKRIFVAVVTAAALAGCGAGAEAPATEADVPASSSTSPQPDAQSPAPELRTLRLADVRTALKGFRTTLHSVPNSNQPTLACEPAPLSSLKPARSVFGEYDGSASSGKVINVHVATAVLDFGDSAGAQEALATVTDWLATCPGATRAKHPVKGAGKVQTLPTPEGPAQVRTLTAAALEVCVDCDAGWFDTQSVVLVDQRLLVVTSVGYIGDLHTEVDPKVQRVVRRAAVVAGTD